MCIRDRFLREGHTIDDLVESELPALVDLLRADAAVKGMLCEEEALVLPPSPRIEKQCFAKR